MAALLSSCNGARKKQKLFLSSFFFRHLPTSKQASQSASQSASQPASQPVARGLD
jgi:hypothetical protein